VCVCVCVRAVVLCHFYASPPREMQFNAMQIAPNADAKSERAPECDCTLGRVGGLFSFRAWGNICSAPE